jgi:hypothetical protein
MDMLSPLKVATAAVVAAAVLVFATVAPLRSPAEVASSPSPSPQATPPSAIPSQLQGGWLGPPKIVGGLVSNATLSSWSIEDRTLSIGYGGTFLRSTVLPDGQDRLRVISPSDDDSLPCHAGAEGSYAWRSTSGDTRLVLEAIEDACAPRAAFLAGEWSKGSCEIAGRACMGLLEPGRYHTGVFDPRGGPGDPPLARMNAFSFEVPAGWSVDEENLSSYELTTADGYAILVAGASGEDVIRLVAQPVALQAYEAPECAWRMDADPERTVDGLADWLADHPGLRASEPSAVSVDGHPGLVIDVDIVAADAPEASCQGVPVLPLFANGAAFATDGSWFDDMVYGDHWVAEIGGGPSDPVRLILLDLDGDPLIILIDSGAPEDQAAFVEQAMPIVESFAFPT